MRALVKQLRLDGKGLSKVLGDLEADVMEVAWSHAHVTVGEVRGALAARKTYSFNTIMTVMNRLVEKEVLVKKESGGVFAYRPKVTRDRFQRDVTRSVLSALLRDGSLFHAAGFVDALDACTKEERAQLQRLIDGTR